MPDRRQHRGPHPDDARLFASANGPALRAATAELSWLYSRGYRETSSIQLVGDRHGLGRRQRVAVRRCACSDRALRERMARRLAADALAGQTLRVDGYNALISVEAALAGGVLLRGRDRCLRDLASVHGTFRRVEETAPALQLLGEVLDALGVVEVRWLLDQPVSNSGRLAALMRELAAARGWSWQVELVPDPDPLLRRPETAIVSADSAVLDGPASWFDLVSAVVATRIPEAWCLDLAPPEATPNPA